MKIVIKLFMTLAVGAMAQAVSQLPRGLGERRADSQCALGAAKALRNEIKLTMDEVEECNKAATESKDKVDEVVGFIEKIQNIHELAENIHDALALFQDTASTFSIFTDKIPKVGAIIAKIRKTLEKFLDKVDSILEKFDKPLEFAHNVTSDISDGLGHLEAFTAEAVGFLESAESKLVTSITCSEKYDCLADDVINGVAGLVPTNPLVIGRKAFDACQSILEPFNEIDIVIDIPNTAVLEEIEATISNIAHWIDDVTREVAAAATYEMCCNNLLRPIGDVLDLASDVVNVAMACWVPLSNPGAAVLQGLFEQFDDILFDQVNKSIGKVVSGVRVLDNVKLEIPRIDLPNLSFDEATCELSYESMRLSTAFARAFGSPSTAVEKMTLGSVLTGIGSAIAEECGEAISALTSRGEFDCCDVARTCDPSDRIILYEGNWCSENIAGTLEVPSRGAHYRRKSSDRLCLANDEARSVMLVGPMDAGTMIEFFNSPDFSCRDDYAAIVLERDLSPEEKLCVGSFEHPTSGVSQTSDYRVTFLRFDGWVGNGLDGKVSGFEVSNNGIKAPRCSLGQYGDYCGHDHNCESNVCARNKCTRGHTGDICGHDGDCGNGRCVDDICRAGVSGDPCERDSDCDGYCGRGVCSDGSPGSLCGHDGDCSNGRCVRDICRAGVTGDPCERDSDCDGYCGRGVCSDGGPGSLCGHDGDCSNGRCVKDVCRAGVPNDPCEKDSDCANGRCVKDVCRAGVPNDPCEKDSDCANSRCVKNWCRAGAHNDVCEKDSDCNSGFCNRDGNDRCVGNTVTSYVSRGAKWGASFSEENGGYSSDSGPIVGVYISDNWGDNKKLRQASQSTCKGTGGRWTGWFSEENPDYVSCASDEYVGQIQCRESRCDDIRLKCVRLNSRCRYTSGSSIKTIQNEATWTGNDEFLWQVKCEDRYCGRLKLGVRRVSDK